MTPATITTRLSAAGFAPPAPDAIERVAAWCVKHGVNGSPADSEQAVQLHRRELDPTAENVLSALGWSYVSPIPGWVFDRLGAAEAA